MYINADQNQCRRILKHADCLRWACQLLLSRLTVDRTGHALWAWYLGGSQCQLASPSLREKGNKSCLSKHILLPNFLCGCVLASRCVLSVLFPALDCDTTPLYRMQLVEKNLKTPRTPTSSKHFNSSSRYCCHHVVKLWASGAL